MHRIGLLDIGAWEGVGFAVVHEAVTVTGKVLRTSKIANLTELVAVTSPFGHGGNLQVQDGRVRLPIIRS
jgi:hypothetical protein